MADNNALEMNECHRTLLGHEFDFTIAKQFMSERELFSGTRHSA